MIKIKRVLLCVFAILFILSGFSVTSADSRWYEDYTTEHGTKLTRDFTFGLKSDFAAAPSDDVFENFKFFRSELPEECRSQSRRTRWSRWEPGSVRFPRLRYGPDPNP